MGAAIASTSEEEEEDRGRGLADVEGQAPCIR